MGRQLERRYREQAIIGRLLARPRDLPAVQLEGLRPDHFREPGAADIARHVWAGVSNTGEILRLMQEHGRYTPEAEAFCVQAGRNPERGSLLNLVRMFMFDASEDATREALLGALQMLDERSVEAWEVRAKAREALSAVDASEDPDAGEDAVAAIKAVVESAYIPDRSGLSTGIPWLDEITGGLKAGRLWCVAAGSGVGKSALSYQMLRANLNMGGRVAHWSIEMGLEEVMQRVLSQESGVPLTRIIRGLCDMEDSARLSKAHGDFPAENYWFSSSTAVTAASVEGEVARLSRSGVKLVVIDQLDLMRHPPADRNDLRIRETTKSLKAIARRHQVAIVLLHQVTRSSASDGRPLTMHDLRDSAVENDCDVVVLLNKMKDKGHVVHMLSVGKNRMGLTGACRVRKCPTTVKFTQCSS